MSKKQILVKQLKSQKADDDQIRPPKRFFPPQNQFTAQKNRKYLNKFRNSGYVAPELYSSNWKDVKKRQQARKIQMKKIEALAGLNIPSFNITKQMGVVKQSGKNIYGITISQVKNKTIQINSEEQEQSFNILRPQQKKGLTLQEVLAQEKRRGKRHYTLSSCSRFLGENQTKNEEEANQSNKKQKKFGLDKQIQSNRNSFDKKRVISREDLTTQTFSEIIADLKKRRSNKKQSKKLKQQWSVLARVNIIWEWRGQTRFYLVDKNGFESRCFLQKQASQNQYRQFLKPNKYYLFSRGITNLDKKGEFTIVFPRTARIIPFNSVSFNINMSVTLRIHQLEQKHNLVMREDGIYINVIGIIKEILSRKSVNANNNKTQFQILLCDPTSLLQIEAKYIYVSQNQKEPQIGDILIVHGFLISEKETSDLPHLVSTLNSYHTFESNQNDPTVRHFQKLKQEHEDWRNLDYSYFRKLKVLFKSLKNLLGLHHFQAKVPQFLSMIDGKVTCIQIMVNSSDSVTEEYTLLITVNDSTASIKLPLPSTHISSLIDTSEQGFCDMCKNQTKQTIDTFLTKFKPCRIHMELKSKKNEETGKYHHFTNKIEVLEKGKLKQGPNKHRKY